MAAHFSPKELSEILRLKDEEGLSHAQIAEKLGRLDSKGLPNARAIMQQYKKAKSEAPGVDDLSKEIEVVAVKIKKPLAPAKETIHPDLNELTRKQRVEYLKEHLPASARGRHVFDNILTQSEQVVFLEEYFSVLREEDSITAAEEQQLFNATLHLILAYRAIAQDKTCFEKSPLGGYKGPDHQIYVDTFKKDYQENMKKYNEFIKSLKLSREQRLKDLQRQGTTFLDFAEKYAKHDEQAEAANEIMSLEKASLEELARLQKNGWLIGGGLSGNNSEINFTGKDANATSDMPIS